MAVIAAYDIAQSFPISAVYTYGQPRTGNKHWVDAFSSRLAGVPFFRVTDYKDPVLQWIVHNMFWEGWAHQYPEVYYGSTTFGSYAVCNNHQDPACSGQWNIHTTHGFGCFHCSYLGMNPCECNNPQPQCTV